MAGKSTWYACGCVGIVVVCGAIASRGYSGSVEMQTLRSVSKDEIRAIHFGVDIRAMELPLLKSTYVSFLDKELIFSTFIEPIKAAKSIEAQKMISIGGFDVELTNGKRITIGLFKPLGRFIVVENADRSRGTQITGSYFETDFSQLRKLFAAAKRSLLLDSI